MSLPSSTLDIRLVAAAVVGCGGCLDARPVGLQAYRADTLAADAPGDVDAPPDAAATTDAEAIDGAETSVADETVATGTCELLADATLLDFGAPAPGDCRRITVYLEGRCASGGAHVDLSFSANDDGAFSIPDGELGAASHAATRQLVVSYCPTTAGAHHGALRVAVTPDTQPDTQGADVPYAQTVALQGGAPCGQVTVAEGSAVAVEATLHLDVQPVDAELFPESNRWSATQPPGAAVKFMPLDTATAPTFEVDAIGAYTFAAVTLFDHDRGWCAVEPATVSARSDAGLHLELFWTTPGDADPSDNFAPDLDLHFVDLSAGGDFFDPRWDCHWPNRSPTWGAEAGSGPVLWADDTDGIGPEDIDWEAPLTDCYAIGAHVRSDFSDGPSTATLRIYRAGVLWSELVAPSLASSDLWTATHFCWPDDAAPALRSVCAKSRAVCARDTDCAADGPCGLDVLPNIVPP